MKKAVLNNALKREGFCEERRTWIQDQKTHGVCETFIQTDKRKREYFLLDY